jgi:allantoinase
MKFDLLIRNGHLLTAEGEIEASIGIVEGSVAEIGDLSGSAREELDATGLHVFPGVIDPHVHFNEPGRTEWEGIATGSAALAAGGGTCFFDMPLNSSPPTLDGESFDLKRKAAEASSMTDFALWGGLTPTNLDKMEELAERGVIGFKAFMCDSGIEDFQRADDWTLYHGMEKAAKLGLPVAVHAENQELVAGRTKWMSGMVPKLTAKDWTHTRGYIAEADAIGRAALFAQSTKCKLHVVHISNQRGVEIAANARPAADISIETCPHYFLLTHEDVTRIGVLAKCAPPIRIAPHVELLWGKVLDGTVDIIGSDHSPAPLSMKTGDFFTAWGGVSGVQSTLAALLTREPALPLERVAKVSATNAAARFNLPRKGKIAVGFDADLAFVDLSQHYKLSREMLLDRHKLSPYVGRDFRGIVRRTIVRGNTVFLDGKTVGNFRGRLIRPLSQGSGNHA